MKLENLKNLTATLESLPEWIITENEKSGTHYLRYSHESLFIGYVKKNSNAWTETEYYNGRFGEGITIKCNNPNSTRFCYKVYYIEKTKKDYEKYLLSAHIELGAYCEENLFLSNCI